MPLSFFLVLGVSVLSSTANAQFLGCKLSSRLRALRWSWVERLLTIYISLGTDNDNFQNQLSTGTRIGVGVALVLGFLILAACFIRHCRARRARGLGGNNGGDGRMFSQWRTQGNNNGAEEGQSSYALQSHLPVIKNTWAAPPPICKFW